MSLIKCSECGKEISDKSKQCVSCGAPIKMVQTKNKVLHFIPIISSIILFLLLLLGYRVMDINHDDSVFTFIFSIIFLIISGVPILLCFYMVPRQRKILFPVSIIISIFVFVSVIGTAFKAFN